MSQITGNNSAVSKEALTAFADKCKKVFQSVPTQVACLGTGNLEITLDTEWESAYFLLQAESVKSGTRSSLYSFIYVNRYSPDGNNVLNLTEYKIEGLGVKDSTIGLQCEGNLSQAQIQCVAYDGSTPIYTPVKSAQTITTFDGTYVSVIGTLGDQTGTVGYIKNLWTGVPDFTITGADGTLIPYTAGNIYNNIQTAGQLSSEKAFKVVIGGAKSSNLSDDEIEVDGDPIIDYIINNTSDTLPIATTERLGVVQIGSGVSVDENGIISVPNVEVATSDSLGTIKIGYTPPTGSTKYKPVLLDNKNRAYVEVQQDIHRYSEMPTPGNAYNGQIVQYIGLSNSEFTQAYFYKCIPVIGFAKSASDTAFSLTYTDTTGELLGRHLAQYFTGRLWDDGSNIDIISYSTLLLKYIDGTWKLQVDSHYYSITADDLKSYLGIVVPSDTTLQCSYIRNATNSYQYYWVQTNVQPAGQINGEDFDYITDEDIYSLTSDTVTGFRIYYEGNEVTEIVTPADTVNILLTIEPIPYDATDWDYLCEYATRNNNYITLSRPSDYVDPITLQLYAGDVIKLITWSLIEEETE